MDRRRTQTLDHTRMRVSMLPVRTAVRKNSAGTALGAENAVGSCHDLAGGVGVSGGPDEHQVAHFIGGEVAPVDLGGGVVEVVAVEFEAGAGGDVQAGRELLERR